ncbi:MAG: radical SAM protein [bacterium]
MIEFCRPTRTLAISLTGSRCALSCAHCGGHYLRGMKTPEEAEHLLAGKDYRSCLISGGSDERGRVPLHENLSFLSRLSSIGLRLNLHTGLVPPESVSGLESLSPTISFDFLVDDETIRSVYGTGAAGKDYLESFRALSKRYPTVPHLTIGLLEGRIRGEYAALEALASEKPEKLVFLVFIPTKGSRFERCSPPPLPEVEKIFSRAREILPGTSFFLGCMRPGGLYRQRLDLLALKYRFSRLVMPSRPAQEMALKLGMQVVTVEECCCL